MSTHTGSTLPTSNRILNALPREEYERLAAYLEPVEMPLGEVLYHPNEPISHVYFPNRGTVSIICTFEDGKSVEAGMVGNEGMFGVGVFLGSITSPLEAVVQLPGEGYRMHADVLRAEFKRGEHLQDLLLRYTQALIIQLAQTAACNRAHPIDGRLARWLLMCQDRAQASELQLTHEFIAIMLGTRRAGVSEAAAKLQDDSVIRYRRGHVNLLDRRKLEAYSCECYEIVKKEFDRLLGTNGYAS
ncbi:MAG: Crp/Fnr family transcriptional regulator [Acidobacteria bacterium]|nr:Crp/Fnr family transcriptional regulator [Acidobacteriota bacterium]